MEKSFITVCSPHPVADPNDYVSQVLADEPRAYYRFKSTTSLTDNQGSYSGAYTAPPVTLQPGPLTNDESGSHAISVPVSSTEFGTLPNSASFIWRSIYDASALYASGDLVTVWSGSNRTFWKAIASTQGDAPATSPTKWQAYTESSTTNPTSLATFTPWTIELWHRYADAAQQNYHEGVILYSHRAVPGGTTTGWGLSTDYVQFGTPSFKWHFYMPDINANIYWNSPEQLSGEVLYSQMNNQWHHIVITNDPLSSSITVYMDGQKMSTTTILAQAGSTEDVVIKNYYNPYGLSNNRNLAQLAFYDRCLSEDRVRAHYNAAP